MQAIVDDLLTQYRLHGKGRVIVLLHGWGDSMSGLQGLETQLSEHYQTASLNLPGFGGSQSPKTSWDLTDYANFVSAWLKKLGIKPYAVIGHSNGGGIAIRGIARKIFSADKLILIASAGIRGEKNNRGRVLQLLVKSGKLLSSPLPSSAKQKLRRKTYQVVGSDMLVAEHLETTFRKVVVDDVRSDAATIHIPTLLIYGENDTATPVHYGRMLHQAIRGSSFTVVPEAGHFVHQEKAHEVERYIEEFLQ